MQNCGAGYTLTGMDTILLATTDIAVNVLQIAGIPLLLLETVWLVLFIDYNHRLPRWLEWVPGTDIFRRAERRCAVCGNPIDKEPSLRTLPYAEVRNADGKRMPLCRSCEPRLLVE